MSAKNRLLLSVMMFLQFFVWGAWFATLGQCLGENGLRDFGGGAYGSAPLAAIIAPLFLGIIADRFFPSEKVMGVLFLIGGAIMCVIPHFATAKDGKTMVLLMNFHMICYMPTLGLGNTITFSNIADRNIFPKVRVWGTIGWIVAGLVTGAMGWSASFNIFWMSGISSLVLGAFCFLLPNTPPPARGQPVNMRALLMVDAFKLLGNVPFLVFAVCSTLICIPAAYYFGLTSNYLGNVGFKASASTMTIGQMSEIFFMLLIPFFFRKLGVKWMIFVGMACWVTRYFLFAQGAAAQSAWMIFLAVALHGICYDFFFVTGFMYTDQKAPAEVRGQAQSMLVFLTQGVGMYFGYQVAFGEFGKTVTNYGKLNEALKAGVTGEPLSYLQSLGKMFSIEPLKTDPGLISSTMSQWKEFWMFPCMMAGVIMVVFALAFWEKKEVTAASEPPKH